MYFDHVKPHGINDNNDKLKKYCIQYISNHLTAFNRSIFMCIEQIHNKSHLMTLSCLSRSKLYSLINLFTETKHFPKEKTLGDSGKKNQPFKMPKPWSSTRLNRELKSRPDWFAPWDLI